jgi:peptide/nickel transport system substrate-binding protein
MTAILRTASLSAVSALALCLAFQPATAKDLTIGFKTDITAADPHVLGTSNRNITTQIYEPLLLLDTQMKPMPGLAESWKLVAPATWEFKLRAGVTFHDGSPLTAEDAKFSIERARDLKGPRTFRTYLGDITQVDAVDERTLRVQTKAPSAILPENIGSVGILSKKAAEGASEADFNSGKAAIGAGPYRWVKWTPGDRIELECFPGYWGGAAKFDKVVYRLMNNDSTRVAALLSGDVDAVDAVPPSLVERLKSQQGIAVQQTTSYFLNYVHLDRHHKTPLYVKGANGEALQTNPFNDLRVRQALSIAINRPLIAQRVMAGTSTPSGQFVSSGMTGFVADIAAPAFDTAKAKALLAEAGFPNGFQLTIHCTNDRSINDAKLCEAIGQMFSAIGVATRVETLPYSVFLERVTSGGPEKESEFSAYMLGFGAANGVADAALKALVATYDTKAGTGANNYVRYSNPELDKLIQAAISEMDPAKRKALLEKATHMAIDDVALIPIHHLDAVWGVRDKLSITPRIDRFTYARDIVEKP